MKRERKKKLKTGESKMNARVKERRDPKEKEWST